MNAGRDALPVRLARRARPRGGSVAYYAFRTGEVATRVLPHRVAYALGAAAADGAMAMMPRRFDGLRDNLRHVLPDADERTIDRVAHANVRNLARSWVDLMEMGHRRDTLSARVHPVDVEHMLEPLERGRGVVIVSLHLGSWEVGLAGWNHRFGSMALLAEVLRPERLFRRVIDARSGMGVKVIPIDVAAMRDGGPETARRHGAAAIRDVYRVLRDNGMVAMAIDRDLVGDGMMLPFFGAQAPIPVGVVEVAIRTGAAIVPVLLLRDGDQVRGVCHPEVAYDPAAPRDEEVRRVTLAVLRVLEAEIRAHPDQWHVLDPIWPAERPAEAAAR